MTCISDDGFYRISRALYAKDQEEEISKGLLKFLRKNPHPEDEELHDWAEENDFDADAVETVAYSLLSDYLDDIEDVDFSDDREEKLHGGKADDRSPEDFDVDQLLKGIKIEMEHTDDPQEALEIAMDHLEEIDDYYDDLEEMEESEKDSEVD